MRICVEPDCDRERTGKRSRCGSCLHQRRKEYKDNWRRANAGRTQRKRKPPEVYDIHSLYRATGKGASEVAIATGWKLHYVERMEREGLTWMSADVAAIRMGLHPMLVWPEWLKAYE